jgi:hypothetical protein
MGILDRPLFRRKLSKDELAMYGIQAFANGGIVSPYNMANGGPTDPSQLLPQTPPEEMYDSGFKSARETLEQAFMKKLNESGFVEELKKAQESGNKQMEDTLMSMYKEMYQREVVDPVEAGSASGNMGGFAVGGEVESENPFGIDLGYTESGAINSDPILGGASLGLSGGGGESSIPSSDNSTSSDSSTTKGPGGRIRKNTTTTVNTTTTKNQSGKYAGKNAGDIIEESEIQEDKNGVQFKIIRRLIRGSKGELRLGGEEKIITFTPEKVINIKGGKKTVESSGTKTDITDNTGAKTTSSDTLAKTADQDPEVAELDTVSRLQQLVKERSELYKQILGDPTKQMASQGFLQLAQFGLNLAAAQGSNFADKVAKSAKDPLTAFAKLAQDAQNDEKGIQLAALKSAEDLLQIETANAGKQATKEQEKKAIFASVYEATNSILNAAKAAGGIQNSLLQTSVVDLITQFPSKEEGKIKTKDIDKEAIFYKLIDGKKVPVVVKEGSKKNKTLDPNTDFIVLSDTEVLN